MSGLLRSAAQRTLRKVLPTVSRLGSSGVYGSTSVVNRRLSPALPSTSRFVTTSSFYIEPPEEMLFPDEDMEKGIWYDLNWSLNRSSITPTGRSFRNLKLKDLEAKGGMSKLYDPAVLPFTQQLENDIFSYLSNSEVLYVQDCALGALSTNEIPVRIITDSPAAAAMFAKLCCPTRKIKLSDYREDVTVYLASETNLGPFLSVDKPNRKILMGGTIKANELVKKMARSSVNAFLARNILPLWGSMENNTLYMAHPGPHVGGFSGFSFSSSGFCRLLNAEVQTDGSIVPMPKQPNAMSLPKSIVMFAHDDTGAIPAATKLTPDQAGFYYITACAPRSLSQYVEAASLMMEFAKVCDVYMVNSGAFVNEDDIETTARAIVGKTGGSADALGLKPIPVTCKTKSPSSEQVDTVSIALNHMVCAATTLRFHV
ncbi:hypothetical protein GUITHDRAFT_112442 [Guillardia theta CCMP2712]|uniref:Phosphoenolpyruvate carboxykinase (ATP) n=1 Tax=Guillardia theta (strain CCMP2712) TaxID=905079 RepID=L1IZ02_GUITC|nr:hypothetical protein GUITHDRAFT_112442 [Guillardia theta CCMP2712]EKX41471.1 hypothetical protein GUITHDRAFT_112442 [Guillardia theta CCMP2712]|eukprot:XP_005828451.1 hypothetical protein GUITHDRAFT_112442 [Guillardia theta CCMP2712]